MLYREEYYTPDTASKGIAELIVAKHRHGATGTIRFLFDHEYTLFKNLTNQT
jgi:replicative DNA helicase